jgi:hypothetical protein
MTNTKTASITVSGLVPNSKYSYEFIGAGANWPATLSQATGLISTNNSTVKTIKTNVHFCVSTGVCPSGSAGVLDYSLDSCPFDADSLYSNLNFILKDYSTNEELYNDIIEVNCSGCLPKIGISFPTSVSLNTDNTYTMTAVVSGISPKEVYNYSFSPISANWPTTLANPTGSFLAKDSSETVSCEIVFCPVTGMCETAGRTISPYTLDNNCINGSTNQFANIRFTVTPVTCGNDAVFSDVLSVICSDCLPRLTITNATGVTLSSPNTNIYSLDHVVSGLRIDEEYSYVYEGGNSNWPTVITPVSGSFIATSRTKTLPARLMFCSPTSICPSGTPGLFDYELDSYAEKLLKQNVLSTSLSLTVTPLSCDIPEKTGPEFTLNCSGCLPSFSYSTLKFADTPELSLNGSCCTGLKSVTVNVSGAVPGDEYIYEFDSASTNVAFSPTSGYVYFGSTGVGYINSIMSVNLVDSQQIVVNCSLTHNDTQIKTIDFLAVKCSGACS